MFRISSNRIATGIGRCLAVIVLVGLTGTATVALGASKKSPANENASNAKDERAWRTQAYSKASEFAQRLMLLEFSEKNNPACESTTKLVDEMRRKSYPIQRVERSSGGEILFKQYGVKTTPTFVLLFDGKELGRVVVGKDDANVTAKRLLTLFQKGRDAVAANPRARAEEPEYASIAKPARGLLFPRALDRATQTRAQASDDSAASSDSDSETDADADSDSSPSAKSDSSILETRAEEISNIIGETRLENSTVRVFVKDPDEGEDREGVGSVIHYIEQYHEMLTVVAASLFTGVSDPTLYPDVDVEFFNAESGKVEKVGAQCVRCDPDTGIAFVAAQVESPVKPVAFLPKKAPIEPSERAVSYIRHGADVVKRSHDVLAVDQRRFYENSEEQSAFVPYVEVSNPPATNDLGAGVFLMRNGRYYFAGILVSNGDKGRVVPATVVSQALLVNRNLTNVYRDQIANKFDAPATSAEIDSAIDRLFKLDRQKKESEQKSRDGATFDANGLSVAFSDPVSSFDESNRPDVAFDAEVPKRADEKISEVAGLSNEQSDLGDFPSNARDAFARSEAAANALAANSSFKLDESFRQKPEKPADPVENALARSEEAADAPAANSSFRLDESFRQKPEKSVDPVENALARSEEAADAPAANSSFRLDESFRQKPEKSVDPVEAALADADRNRSKNADAESDVAQTRVMFNGREPLPEPADEQPASKPTPSVASKPESTPRVVANEQTLSSPYDEPLPDPRDSLLAADPTPSRSTALESSPAEEIADAPFPDPFDSPLTDPQDSLLAADPTPSQSSALESSPSEEIADAPFPDPFDSPLTDPQDSLLAADPAPTQSSALESAPAETPVTAPSARSDSQRVAHDAPSDAATSSYAVDQLPTPNSDVVRSVTFSNRERVETFNREEDEFETALDSLRRRGTDGAEIICVVNWSNGSGVRDAEVVRLPKHAGLTNNAASGAVKSHYAADQLPTPNSDLTRSTPSASREEDEFETALDSLRRRGMNGAEIVCIVNWPDGSGVRETEVVRLPKRAVRTNPAAPGAGVELARKPEPSGVAGQSDAPLTSSRPDARVYK